jgi:hypothetical protein
MGLQTSYRLGRKVGQGTLVENGEYTIDLPRIQDFDYVGVELIASVQVTTAGTAVRAEAPCQLLKRIQFIADGKDVLDDVSFTTAALANYPRSFFRDVTPPSAASVATYAVRAYAILDRSRFDALRPKDTSFQAWLTKLLQLRVMFGACNNLFTGSPVSVLTGGSNVVNIYVGSHQELDKPNDAGVPVSGTSDQGEPKRVLKRTQQQLVFTGANSAQQFVLPIGNTVRMITVHAMDNTNAAGVGEPSNSLVNNLKLSINDVDVRYSRSGLSTRSHNAADCALPNMTFLPTGYYVIDSSPEGKFREFFDLRGTPNQPVTKAVLELDLAAPTTQGVIEVVVDEEIY